MNIPYLDLSMSGTHLGDHHFFRNQQMIIYYVTFLLILFVIITASCIFIEFVAAFTKKCIDIMVDHMTSDLPKAPDARIEPRMVKHQLLDKTCPLTSDTHDERSEKEDNQSSEPSRPCAPCGICCRSLTMGDLIRRFPCDHSFHARCVDRACIIEEESKNPIRLPGAYLQCPVCSHVIFPTPDLMTNCIISIE